MKAVNFLVLLTTLIFTSAALAQNQPVIGIVNLEQALFNSEVAREMQAQIETEFRSDQQRADRLNTELRELVEKAQRDESIMSDAEKRELNSTAQEKQVQLQLISERVQTALQERQQRFVDSQRQNLGRAIEAVVQEGGYDLVLNAESVAFFNNSYSITALVTAKLNELNSASQ
ncbi:MAG: OmpH family outer membrane protein [Pseudomonadales bacterium]|nr:OmpH family outer membrane protein [Pseudomonadales bacterium]